MRNCVDARNAFTSTEEDLNYIQGTWERTRRAGPGDGPSRITYTFSQNEFSRTVRAARSIFGTFEIRDDILMLIVNNNVFGLYVVEYTTDNVLFLHDLMWHRDSWAGGKFTKQ